MERIVNGVTYNGDVLVRCNDKNCKSLTIEYGTKIIDDYAFENMDKLEEIHIPDTVTEIKASFCDCDSLNELFIPSSVQKITEGAFYCSNVNSIEVDNKNPNLKVIDGVLYNGDKLLHCTFDRIDFLKVVEGTRKICIGAFCDSDIGELVLPESLEEIEDEAFIQSSIEKLNIPSKVNRVGMSAFSQCGIIRRIEMYSSNAVCYGYEFFCETEVEELYIGKDVSWIDYSFLNNGDDPVQKLIIEAGNPYFKEINGMVCYNNTLIWCEKSLTGTIRVPDGIDEINGWAFDNSLGITKIILPRTVTSIADFVFAGLTDLQEIEVDSWNRTYSVNKGLLYEGNTIIACPCQKYGSAEIQPGTLRIGESAFSNCKNITSIKIPDTVNQIDFTGFQAMESLYNIDVDPFNFSFMSVDGVLYDKRENELIVCPCEKRGTVVIPKGIVKIQSGAFDNCFNVIEIRLPETIEEITIYSFYKLSNLREINVDPNNCVFSSVEGILYNQGILLVCPSGKKGSIDIPKGVTEISDSAFYNCKRVKKIMIPDTVKKIKASNFDSMDSLEEITVEEGNAAYYSRDGILYQNNGLLSCPPNRKGIVTIPKNINSIPYNAFSRCQHLDCILVEDGNAIYKCIEGSLFDKAGRCYFRAEPTSIGAKLSNIEELVVVQAYLDGSLKEILKKHHIKAKNNGVTRDKNLRWYGLQTTDKGIKKHIEKILKLTDFFK